MLSLRGGGGEGGGGFTGGGGIRHLSLRGGGCLDCFGSGCFRKNTQSVRNFVLIFFVMVVMFEIIFLFCLDCLRLRLFFVERSCGVELFCSLSFPFFFLGS